MEAVVAHVRRLKRSQPDRAISRSEKKSRSGARSGSLSEWEEGGERKRGRAAREKRSRRRFPRVSLTATPDDRDRSDRGRSGDEEQDG